MRTLEKFNYKNSIVFYAQLEEAKKRLLELCVREIDGVRTSDVSVVRYNMAREDLKAEFPTEVIGMLDASGFINEVLSADEKKWLKVRKERGGRS